MAEQLIGHDAAEDEENEPDDRVERLAGREEEHREEDPEEEHGRAHVLLEDHHEHRNDPHGHDRHEVRHRRHRERPDAALGVRQHLAVLLEVGGEEDHKQDLHGFPRLDAPRPDFYPDPRAVDLSADDRKERRDEQQDAEQRPRPLVPGEGGEVARHDDRGREGSRSDDRPRELLQEEIRREPLDQHESDRGESGGDRQKDLVAAKADADEEDV